MQRKKHSREEIATKLSKADELHERGKTQAEIARTLGVSAMTYHRWRKTRSQPGLNGTRVPDLPQSAVEELHKENRRLRQLLTDLSLEKLKLQEIVGRSRTVELTSGCDRGAGTTATKVCSPRLLASCLPLQQTPGYPIHFRIAPHPTFSW